MIGGGDGQESSDWFLRNAYKGGSRGEEMPSEKKTYKAKVVVVGDGACGKTCLLEAYKTGNFLEDYVPTIVDNFAVTEVVDEKREVVLTLWDTSGQDEYDALRPLSYSNANLILICYSIENKDVLANVEEKWVAEVQNLCKNVPYFLVGLKSDIRDTADPSKADKFVTTAEGETIANGIGARKFFECSALTKKNVKSTFNEVARYIAEHRKEPSAGRGLRFRMWCCSEGSWCNCC